MAAVEVFLEWGNAGGSLKPTLPSLAVMEFLATSFLNFTNTVFEYI